MPSSAHGPAGESRDRNGEKTEAVPAAGHEGHGAAAAGAASHGAASAGAATAPGQQPYAYSPPAALSTMTPRHWWVPAVAGAAGYVGMVLGTVLAMLLTLLGAAIAGDSSGSLTDQVDNQIGTFTGEAPDLSGAAWFLLSLIHI